MAGSKICTRTLMRVILLSGCLSISVLCVAQKTENGGALDSILRSIDRQKDPSKKIIGINSVVKDFNDNSPKSDSLLQVADQLCADNKLERLRW